MLLLLLLPGGLLLTTEFGLLEVCPGEVVVVPRGVRFSVALMDGAARGYVLEVFQGHFTLPDLGPIGGGWGDGGGLAGTARMNKNESYISLLAGGAGASGSSAEAAAAGRWQQGSLTCEGCT